LIYFAGDEHLQLLAKSARKDIQLIPYTAHESEIKDGITYLKAGGKTYPIQVFGNHNLQNLNAAKLVCTELGVSDDQFYAAIHAFSGAAKRLELVYSNSDTTIFKDFAHSPSKLKATTEAVREQFPNRKLIACMELHTFSSLNEHFLSEYTGSMAMATKAYVYFNPHTVAHKKLIPITTEQVQKAFGTTNVEVYTDSALLINELRKQDWRDANLLMMSSGNFDGLKFEELPVVLGV
jgi:UDP-N-acetylmuramate: L-alanyl-gamma-D-glutamyl-meso-diaminopimelate ligase